MLLRGFSLRYACFCPDAAPTKLPNERILTVPVRLIFSGSFQSLPHQTLTLCGKVSLLSTLKADSSAKHTRSLTLVQSGRLIYLGALTCIPTPIKFWRWNAPVRI
jgi:hypothetical protein